MAEHARHGKRRRKLRRWLRRLGVVFVVLAASLALAYAATHDVWTPN